MPLAACHQQLVPAAPGRHLSRATLPTWVFSPASHLAQKPARVSTAWGPACCSSSRVVAPTRARHLAELSFTRRATSGTNSTSANVSTTSRGNLRRTWGGQVGRGAGGRWGGVVGGQGEGRQGQVGRWAGTAAGIHHATPSLYTCWPHAAVPHITQRWPAPTCESISSACSLPLSYS